MQKFMKNFGHIIMIIIEIVIGTILLIKPLGFTKIIIIGAGIALIVFGIIDIVKYFKSNIVDAIKEQKLSRGLILLSGGLFCTLSSNWFIVTFPLLTVLYGIIIFVTGLTKIQGAIDAYRLKRKYWYIPGINAVLTIIFGIIIINNPFKTITVLWIFTGIALIVAAIFDVINMGMENKETEEKEEIIENKEVKDENKTEQVKEENETKKKTKEKQNTDL